MNHQKSIHHVRIRLQVFTGYLKKYETLRVTQGMTCWGCVILINILIRRQYRSYREYINITDQVELAKTEERITKQKAKQLYNSGDIDKVEIGTFA